MDRRTFMQLTAAQTTVLGLGLNARPGQAKPKVAVIGGGVFGVWTAWYALQAGAHVTLIDAYQPGHSRASSGGETRQIHDSYSNPIYNKLVTRSMGLWQHWESQWNTQLFYKTGRLMMASKGGRDQALATHERVAQAGTPSEIIAGAELSKRWPQINMDGVDLGVWMSEIGLLAARRGVETVARQFQRAGGSLRIAKMAPGDARQSKLSSIREADGSSLEADIFVFACGPWLPKIFPEVLGTKLRPVRRDVFFVGSPAGDNRFEFPNMPTWTLRGAPGESHFTNWYGFPSFEGRGMKVCSINEANSIDPDLDSRMVSPLQAKRAREFISRRFPILADQPFTETRVCQVTDSIGSNFLVDRHPAWNNVWLVGGGAGHGYKHGPGLGQYVAARILDGKQEPDFDETFKLNPDSLNIFQRN